MIETYDYPNVTIRVEPTPDSWVVEATAKHRIQFGQPQVHRATIPRCKCGRPAKSCHTRQFHPEAFAKYLGQLRTTFKKPRKASCKP